MGLETIDWVLILVFILITVYIGFRLSGRAGKNITEFFLSGRNLPWYIAGISMVATTFAADTPLAVTELVSSGGIAGNWLWWNMLIGGMLTTFFFARLWRRAEILTEVEFIELRYGGKGAAFLRGFKSLYLGLFMNVLILGWVNLAFMSILEVFFGIPESQLIWYTAGAMMIIALYSTLSGLWGVAINDAIQFVIAMTGSIMLAIFVLNSEEVGGIAGLKAQLPESSFRFFPSLGEEGSAGSIGKNLTLGMGAFFAYIGIQWWASWYPGAEPGGGGYIAQRMMSAKDEKNSLYATLFFQVAHYTLRPWPWIIVGLAAMVLYPGLPEADKKLGYVMAMKDFLPAGWKGLMLIAFIAAYMSTISTQLNWGSSYLVNDFYKRFIQRGSSESSLIAVSRYTTIALAVVSLLVTTQLETIAGVWRFIIECGAGLGLVLILRWYWWRINIWSEISATLIPFIVYAVANYILNWEFPDSFFLTVSVTTVGWLVITFVTPPEKPEILEHFYQKVRPGGAWGLYARGESPQNLLSLFISWILAVLMAYSFLFFTGKVIFLEWQEAFIFGLAFLVFLFLLILVTKRTRVFA